MSLPPLCSECTSLCHPGICYYSMLTLPSHSPFLYQQISMATCFPYILSQAPSPVLLLQSLCWLQPLSHWLIYQIQALILPLPCHSACMCMPPPLFTSLTCSPPHLIHILVQHCPSSMPLIAGTAPAISRPLTSSLSGTISSTLSALDGLALLQAKAIGELNGGGTCH